MSMFICKLKWVGLLVLTLCALGAPAIALTHPATGERPEKKKPAAVRQALPQQAAAIDAAQEDSEALQGGWEGQSAEQDGKSLPDEEVKKLRVSIKGDRMMIIPGGEWTPLKFKLDPTKSPKVLRMAPGEGPEKDKVVPVIYRLNKAADMLTLCWDAKEGKAVPEDFSSKKGSGLMLVVLKHERPLTTPAAVKE